MDLRPLCTRSHRYFGKWSGRPVPVIQFGSPRYSREMPESIEDAGEKFRDLVSLMARLRAPGGCPWDRKQTFDSIKPYTLEETYEVLDAIDNRDWPGLSEELGDFLLQAAFY